MSPWLGGSPLCTPTGLNSQKSTWLCLQSFLKATVFAFPLCRSLRRWALSFLVNKHAHIHRGRRTRVIKSLISNEWGLPLTPEVLKHMSTGWQCQSLHLAPGANLKCAKSNPPHDVQTSYNPQCVQNLPGYQKTKPPFISPLLSMGFTFWHLKYFLQASLWTWSFCCVAATLRESPEASREAGLSLHWSRESDSRYWQGKVWEATTDSLSSWPCTVLSN